MSCCALSRLTKTGLQSEDKEQDYSREDDAAAAPVIDALSKGEVSASEQTATVAGDALLCKTSRLAVVSRCTEDIFDFTQLAVLIILFPMTHQSC